MNKENIHIVQKEKCKIGLISLRSDKILMFKPLDGVTTCNIENLKEMYSIYMDITKGVPHLYYTDNTNIRSFGPEERTYVSSNFHHFAIASAIKENSPLTRFITHSMIYLNKPQIPLKMFKTEEDCIKWLKSLDIS